LKLLLIRHAEPDYSIDSLTAKGRVEAELLAHRLAQLSPVKSVYTSPLGRARDTAAPYEALTGHSAQVRDWLREFRASSFDPDKMRRTVTWDFRPRTWKPQSQLYDRDQWVTAPLLTDSRSAEIWQETKDGTDSLLAENGFVRNGPVYACKNNTEGYILVFCHFGIATAMLAYLAEISPVLLWQGFCMQPSSVTTLVTEERVKGEVVWRCMSYGDQSHLWAAGERYSTAGLYPEVYDGRDTTSPKEWENQTLEGKSIKE